MSNTTLKLIALVSMVLDHIWRFFPDSPYFFHLIGRISAPIFLFCCVESYIYTSNRKKLFIRVYFLNIIVELMNLILGIGYLRMNFIRSILLVLIIVFIIDQFKRKKKKAKLYLIIFIVWQSLITVLICSLLYIDTLSSIINENLVFLIISITANISYLDGGILIVLIGVYIFIYRENKLKLSISFICITIIYVILFNTTLINRLDMLCIDMPFINTMFNIITNTILGIDISSIYVNIFTGDPQWMMIFSLPFFLMYNNKKGKGLKYLFYIVYPVHIAILYELSTLKI